MDAVDTVLLQWFGVTHEVQVRVSLKTSMAANHVLLAQELVTLNTQNNYQAVTRVQVRRDRYDLDQAGVHLLLDQWQLRTRF